MQTILHYPNPSTNLQFQNERTAKPQIIQSNLELLTEQKQIGYHSPLSEQTNLVLAEALGPPVAAAAPDRTP